jgi:hypothetical protein
MNPAMAKRRTGEIGLYTGKTRSGKTYQLKKRVAREKRIIVWSVKESVDHYARDLGGTVIRTLQDLKQAVTQIGKGPGRLIYTPRSMADFGQWAVCAHAWGVFAPCSAIAEELALPPVKIHCSILAEDAIKAAVNDYREKHDHNNVISSV